jgi:hypothetical protein
MRKEVCVLRHKANAAPVRGHVDTTRSIEPKLFTDPQMPPLGTFHSSQATQQCRFSGAGSPGYRHYSPLGDVKSQVEFEVATPQLETGVDGGHRRAR